MQSYFYDIATSHITAESEVKRRLMSISRRKSFLVNSILVFASFFVIFLFLEIGIRIYISMQGTKFGIMRIEHFSRSWPLLQEVQGKKYYYELIPSLKKTLEGSTYQTDDYGLRNNQEKFSRDPNSFHILTIGCSMTFGVGVSNEDTYSSILEKKLNDYFSPQGRKFQVWNGGVPARSIDQIAGALEQKTIFLKPDMVIYGFLIDTIIRPSWHFKDGILYEPQKGYWLQQLVYRSRLASFIVFQLKNQKYNPYNYFSDYYKKVDERWGYAMGQIERMNSLCKEQGIPFVVVDLATPFWQGRLKKEDWIEYPYNLKLEKLCKKEGVSYINTIYAFEGLEAKPLWAIPDYDPHYNPTANRLVAESIFKSLNFK